MRKVLVFLIPVQSGPGCGEVLAIGVAIGLIIAVLTACLWVFGIAKDVYIGVFYPSTQVTGAIVTWDPKGGDQVSPDGASSVSLCNNGNICITGANSHQITDNSGFAGNIYDVHYRSVYWSPTNQSLIVSEQTSASGNAIVLFSGDTPIKVIANSWAPSWSPDGKFIAFCEGSDVHLLDSEGKNDTFLTTQQQCGRTMWSPDGKQVYFVAANNSPNSDQPLVTGPTYSANINR